MRTRILTTASLAVTLALIVACSDGPLAPSMWLAYRLRAINGRPLPTSYTSQAPADSFYWNRKAEQYRFLSDTLVARDAYLESTELNPDGSVTHRNWICWEGLLYRYRQVGDSLLLTRVGPYYDGPPTPPVLLLRSGSVHELTADTLGPIRLRYDLASPLEPFCPRLEDAELPSSVEPPRFGATH